MVKKLKPTGMSFVAAVSEGMITVVADHSNGCGFGTSRCVIGTAVAGYLGKKEYLEMNVGSEAHTMACQLWPALATLVANRCPVCPSLIFASLDSLATHMSDHHRDRWDRLRIANYIQDIIDSMEDAK